METNQPIQKKGNENKLLMAIGIAIGAIVLIMLLCGVGTFFMFYFGVKSSVQEQVEPPELVYDESYFDHEYDEEQLQRYYENSNSIEQLPSGEVKFKFNLVQLYGETDPESGLPTRSWEFTGTAPAGTGLFVSNTLAENSHYNVALKHQDFTLYFAEVGEGAIASFRTVSETFNNPDLGGDYVRVTYDGNYVHHDYATKNDENENCEYLGETYLQPCGLTTILTDWGSLNISCEPTDQEKGVKACDTIMQSIKVTQID